MPKTLSLKKANSQTHQKSITQFFKTDTKQSEVTTPTQNVTTPKSSSKRKVLSPTLVYDFPSNLGDDEKHQVVEEIPKRHKICPTNSLLKSPTKADCTNKYFHKANNHSLNHTISHNAHLTVEISDFKTDSGGDKLLQPMEQNVQKKISPNISIIDQCPANSVQNHNTPISSPVKDGSYTPEKCNLEISVQLSPLKSPSKCSLSNKEHMLYEDPDDVFNEDWDLNDFKEEQIEILDLSILQRCEVLSIRDYHTRLELQLKNNRDETGTCYIEGFWLDITLSIGDIISIIASKGPDGQFKVDNSSGLLVLRPDYLVSSTSVVAGVFCKRKAVLQERWKGSDCSNAAMIIGCIIHELVQKVLTENITDVGNINVEAERIIKDSMLLIYEAGLTEEEVRNNMLLYIPSLFDFMQTYVSNHPVTSRFKQDKDKWNGHINKVLDIEENLCCPQLGLKGKIDATLEVTIHQSPKRNKDIIVPLELKSGRASISAEHRGQLVLYGMMLSILRNENPTLSEQRGLLLYLKDQVQLREISCGYPERRDLIMLRNQLVQNLAPGSHDCDTEKLVDIEEACSLLQQKLPEPINRENICSKCPYLTTCSIHLWHTDGPKVTENHPLFKLRELALGHLSPEHINYFFHWSTLLVIEERRPSSSAPLHNLWTNSAVKRESRGTCIANLVLKSVQASDSRFLHTFQRQSFVKGFTLTESRGPQENEYCIVSLDDRPWVAAGVLKRATENEVLLYLERDLSKRFGQSTRFHVDAYESYTGVVHNLTNLGVLLEDTERSQRLRCLIIDKEPPRFDKKLPREIGRLGTKIMRSLNIEQQRAVLRCLAAKDYALLRGLPGTGKTQTVSVLIQMLVALKQRVLVTAHTHSAVDNVLARLPKSIRIMRLGPKSRVAESLVDRCEHTLVEDCKTVHDLESLYESMEVVGVTCLGASHAMLSRTTFDVCIVDEATQVLQCTVLLPLFAARKFVLVGDPDQLPPVIKSRAARRLGMEESLFHRLMSEESTSTLHLQYRMNGPLAEVANRVSYDGQLKCAGDAISQSRLDIKLENMNHLLVNSTWLSAACSPKAEYAAVFLDVKAEGTTKEDARNCFNKTEACLVLALIDALVEGGVKCTDIGVIAPFRDQVALLKRNIGRVEVSTVDQFQGRDKSVILYSCTKKHGDEDIKVKEGEVLNDQRRLAVSVTRAKHKLIVLGDSRVLSRYGPLVRLMDACNTLVLDNQHIIELHKKYLTQLL